MAIREEFKSTIHNAYIGTGTLPSPYLSTHSREAGLTYLRPVEVGFARDMYLFLSTENKTKQDGKVGAVAELLMQAKRSLSSSKCLCQCRSALPPPQHSKSDHHYLLVLLYYFIIAYPSYNYYRFLHHII